MNDEVKEISKFKAWVQAMRLRTLPLSFSVIIVGNALAYSSTYFIDCQEPIPGFRWDIFGLTLLTTLLLQILSNFANDYGDSKKGADNEERIGPERAVQSGVLSSKEMLKGIVFTSLLSLTSGICLLYVSFGAFNQEFLAFLGLGLFSILGAIGYTVGKRAYGYYGMGDFFVFFFFGLLGVNGSYYLHYPELHLPVMIFGVMMGALATAVLNLNNMRDRLNDEKVGKKTLAVRMGFKGSKFYHYSLFAVFWVPLFGILLPHIEREWPTLLAYLPVFLIHAFHLGIVYNIREPKDYDPLLKHVALSSFLFSIILFVSLYLEI